MNLFWFWISAVKNFLFPTGHPLQLLQANAQHFCCFSFAEHSSKYILSPENMASSLPTVSHSSHSMLRWVSNSISHGLAGNGPGNPTGYFSASKLSNSSRLISWTLAMTSLLIPSANILWTVARSLHLSSARASSRP